ncbi:MAG: hypothetical protein AAFX39_10145 [Pseudomonadota bacterium]
MKRLIVLALCLVAAASLAAMAQADEGTASPEAGVSDHECTSCTARHRSLQALQRERLSQQDDRCASEDVGADSMLAAECNDRASDIGSLDIVPQSED